MNIESAKALERALHARRGGNALLCYDLATRALAEHPDETRLAYPAVLALADLGNLELAAELYERYRARMRTPDEDWLALRGRLYKELALRDPDRAADYFRHAAQAYESAFAATARPYSGVNAASMHVLAGDAARAQQLAADVLGRLHGERLATDSDRYFHHVTGAEASLVLGRLDDAAAGLRAADAFLPRDAALRARTRRQLALLLRARGLDETVLQPLAMPSFLYVAPGAPEPAAAPVAELLRRVRISTLFFVPGHTVEIELAEQMLAAGIAVHAVLPGAMREVLAAIAARWGGNWSARLEHLLAQTQDQSPVTGFVGNESDRALAYARQVAQGLAQLRARQCDADAQRLQVARSGSAVVGQIDGAAAVSALEPVWQCPPEASAPEAGEGALQRRQAAMIFADMTGFSQLHDRDLPAYWNTLMPEIARALARHGHHVLLQSTWGDALYIVLDSAQPAAAAGLDILAALERARRELPGGLAQINVRLSIHYGPVFTGWDPVGLGKLYYGSHVSMAARIEPVTPPGSIYVTEALAAQLALEGAGEFELIYAGEIELAKRYGKRRMFHLRAAHTPRREAAVSGPEHIATTHELVLGCTGSLLLTREQRQWVREALQDQVLPVLRDGRASTSLTLAMGLAPGADLLFVDSARDWCIRRGLPWRIRTLLPVPPEMLLSDWNDKAMSTGNAPPESEARTHWAAMSRVLNESATVINLWAADADVVRLATRSFRQHQYRKLGAELVQQSDVLIAICDPRVNGDAGGAVEVTNWRKNPQKIPPEFLGEGPPPEAQARSLVLLNPVTREVRLEL